MKSYEEMTQSVLEKAKIRKAAQRRRNRRIAFVVSGLCCAFLVIGIGEQLNTPTEPIIIEKTEPAAESTGIPSNTDETKADAPRITLLTALPSSESEKAMLTNVEVPIKTEIRVYDRAEQSQEELQQILSEERAYIRQIAGENALDYSYSPYGGENVFISSLSLGCLAVRFEDVSKVARIRASVTDSVACMCSRRSKAAQIQPTGE